MERDLKIGKAIFFWFLTAGYMGLIFYLSSQSSFSFPRLPENFDKLGHMCIYILLAFLTFFSLKNSGIKNYLFLAAFLMSSLYGVSDEFHQAFVPYREPAVDDLLADMAGAFVGSLGANLLSS